MSRGYTYIPLTVAVLCYAIADCSVATLSNCVLPWLAGSLAILRLIGVVGRAWVGAESGVQRVRV